MDGDVTAWIALGLSVVAILVQVWTRYLDGGRIRVSLRAVFWSPATAELVTLRNGRWPFQASMRPVRLSEGIELAEVVVENNGRLPITVLDVGLTWLDDRQPGKLRRSRNHVVPRILAVPDMGGPQAYIDGEDIRVEPYDRFTILVDYWSTLPPDRLSKAGVRSIRASARVAGRRHAKHSSRKLRWRIPDRAFTAFPGQAEPTAEMLIAREAIRLSRLRHDPVRAAGFLAEQLAKHIAGHWPTELTQQRLMLDAFFDSAGYTYFDDDRDSFTRLNLELALTRTLTAYRDRTVWPHSPAGD